MNRTEFADELERQARAYESLGYQQATGFDRGMWYGGFISLFYREYEENPACRLSLIDATPQANRIPFLLVMGEMMVSVPRQMQLLNEGTWNCGGKPDLFRGTPMGHPYRAWLAVDVELHPWPGGACDYLVAQEVGRRDRRHASLCDGIALAVTHRELLIHHRAFGCFGSAPRDREVPVDYEAPYLHAEPSPWDQGLPPGRPNVFSHSVGLNTFNGLGGAILSYGSMISLESVTQESFRRYQLRCGRASEQ